MGRRAHIWFWKKRGQWCVDIDRQRHYLGPDRDEAERTFHSLKSKPKRKTIPTDGLCVLIDEFLAWVSNNRAPDTLEWYQRRLRAFDERYPDLHVNELKPFHVQWWIDSCDVSSGTKRNMCRAIQRCMRWCEEQGHIERSPISHMKKPAGGARDAVISEKEYEAIQKHAKDGFKDLVAFAWETGARAIELFAMEIRHVELANHRVVFPITETKMRKIPRVLYLSPAAEQILKRLIGRRKQGHVFQNAGCRPWTADSVNCAFRRIELKLKKKYCLTAIRHTWCHRKLISGVDALTVSVLMGHADTSMVARVYSHLTQAPDHLLHAVRGSA